MPYENLVMGQGPAKLASDEDLERDEVGFTNPNLHRRIDPHAEEGEYLPQTGNIWYRILQTHGEFFTR